ARIGVAVSVHRVESLALSRGRTLRATLRLPTPRPYGLTPPGVETLVIWALFPSPVHPRGRVCHRIASCARPRSACCRRRSPPRNGTPPLPGEHRIRSREPRSHASEPRDVGSVSPASEAKRESVGTAVIDEESLRLLIHRKIRDGRLPRDRASRVLGLLASVDAATAAMSRWRRLKW